MVLIAAALIAFTFGILQFLFNIILFPAVFAGKMLKVGGLLFLKIGFYALGLWLLLKVFRAFLVIGLTGFGAGFFIFLIIYAIAKLKKK